MSKKCGKNVKIFGTAGAALIIVAALLFLTLTDAGKNILAGKGKADSAISSGIIEIASQKDVKDYFVFMSPDEARKLLEEARNNGQEKMLLPQFDVAFNNNDPIVIESRDGTLEGSPFKFIVVKGLPSGIKIYSSVGGYVRGGVIRSGTAIPYVWMKEVREEEDTGVAVTYVPALVLSKSQNPVFIGDVEDIYGPIELGAPLVNLMTDSALDESLVSGGAQIAMAWAGDDGVYNKFELKNILTYRGRMVMAQTATEIK